MLALSPFFSSFTHTFITLSRGSGLCVRLSERAIVSVEGYRHWYGYAKGRDLAPPAFELGAARAEEREAQRTPVSSRLTVRIVTDHTLQTLSLSRENSFLLGTTQKAKPETTLHRRETTGKKPQGKGLLQARHVYIYI